ncbi:RCC1 domain-containing protein [Schaalia sp. lx-100]|uniref:RCC1 domain-containing protein n=1 Tax=Schaalia sp. lx-100 TaxID=2899081 RepID=UPI001E59D5EC|nr:SdrD B-like domain-containing protein [Schaalia sp. lx-100]MCD4557468.1 hypothetical protein [Schaalia sp. lx-100]
MGSRRFFARRLVCSLAVATLSLTLVTDASTATTVPNPYASATLTSDYDGTGHDVRTPSGGSAQTFINAANGFEPGDNTKDDGVVASGDFVGLTSYIRVEPGPERLIQVRYTIPEWLDFDAKANPTLAGGGNTFITQVGAPKWDPTSRVVTVTYRTKRGVPVALSAPLVLTAKDTAGEAKSDQVVKVEVANDDNPAYSSFSSKGYTVVSAPRADIMVRPSNYDKSEDGAPYFLRAPYTRDERFVEVEVYPRPVVDTQWSPKGASTLTSWSGYLDVSGLPEGTTAQIGGADVPIVNGKIRLPKTSGSLTVRFFNNDGWGIPVDQMGSYEYPLHVELDKDAFSTPDYLNNGDGWQPGSDQKEYVSTAGARNTTAVRGFYSENNDYTRLRFYHEQIKFHQKFVKEVLRPSTNGATYWEAGMKDFDHGYAARAKYSGNEYVTEDTQLKVYLYAYTNRVILQDGSTTAHFTFTDQWNPREQVATGPIQVLMPNGKEYEGERTVEWYVGERPGGGKFQDESITTSNDAGWVTSDTPPAGASALRVKVPNLPIGEDAGGDYKVYFPARITDDFAKLKPLPVSFTDRLIGAVNGVVDDPPYDWDVFPLEKAIPTGRLNMTVDDKTLNFDDPTLTYTITPTVRSLISSTQSVSTRLDVTLDPCVTDVTNVGEGWSLLEGSLEIGDCATKKPGKATFLVGKDGSWVPTNYSRGESEVTPLTFDARVSTLALGDISTKANWVLNDYEQEGRIYPASASTVALPLDVKSTSITTDDPRVEKGQPMRFTAVVAVASQGQGLGGEAIIELPSVRAKDPLPANYEGADKSAYHGGYTLSDVSVDPKRSVPGTTIQFEIAGAEGTWVDSIPEGKADQVTRIKIIQPTGGQQGISTIKYTLRSSDHELGDTYVTWISGATVPGTDHPSPDPWPAFNEVVASQVTGYVYWDEGGNGRDRQKNSKGIEGVTLGLFRGDEKLAETTTNAEGYYAFPRDFIHGDYKVKILEGVPETVRSQFNASTDPSVTQTYSYKYRRFGASQKVSDTVNLGIDEVFENVNFGFYAREPHVDIQKKPAEANCRDTECTVEWAVTIKNDGNTRQSAVQFNDVLAGNATDVTVSYGTPEQNRSMSTFAEGVSVDQGGELWTWGPEACGIRGLPADDPRIKDVRPSLVATPGVLFNQVASGHKHRLALDREGHIWVWGYNALGQLGLAATDTPNLPKQPEICDYRSTINTRIPTKIQPDTVFTHIAAGPMHSLAVDAEGNVWTWGENRYGELGIGTQDRDAHPIPQKLDIPVPIARVFASGTPGLAAVSFALDVNGQIWAWGSNEYRNLGLGNTVSGRVVSTPTKITSTGEIKFVDLAPYYSSVMAIDSNNNLWGWGNNGGRWGTAYYPYSSNVPRRVQESMKFTRVVTGGSWAATYALDTEGNLWGWGEKRSGLLTVDGDGHQPPKILVPDKKFSNIFMSSTGYMQDTDGTIYSVGYASSGLLGYPGGAIQFSPREINFRVPAAKEQVIAPTGTRKDGNILTRSYSLPDMLPGTETQLLVSAKVPYTNVKQVLANQAIVSSKENPRTGVTPPELRSPDVAQTDKLRTNTTCSSDVTWNKWEMPGDQCDQVETLIPANTRAIEPAAVSGRVWVDEDREGIERQNSDRHVSGVDVYLLDGTGNTVATTVTATDGTFRFDGVAPGTYSIQYAISDQTTVPDPDKPGATLKVLDYGAAFISRAGESFSVDVVAPRADGSITHTRVQNAPSGGEAPNFNTAIEMWVPNISVTKTTTVNDEDNPGHTKEVNKIQVGPTESTVINFTIKNNGAEDLVDPQLEDTTTQGNVNVGEITCEWEKTTIDGTEHNVLPVGKSLTCTATLPALGRSAVHEDEVRVWAVGLKSGKLVEDKDTFTETTPDAFEIHLEKKDGYTDKELEGATFNLKGPGLPEQGKELKGGPKWTFDLAPGDYELRELVAPAGFARLPAPWKFTVTKEGIVTRSAPLGEDGVVVNGAVVTVKNWEEGKLPTAGRGQMIAIIGGGLLLTIAGIMIALRRKEG